MQYFTRNWSIFGATVICLTTMCAAPLAAQEPNAGLQTGPGPVQAQTPADPDLQSSEMESLPTQPEPKTGEQTGINDEIASPQSPEEFKALPLRGDDGVLMDFRPSGVSFITPDRLLICDSANQQLHIFDLEGRRFRRVPVNRNMPSPNYSGIARLDDHSFLVVGDHYHVNNDVRFINAHSVLHRYTLLGELFTDDSAKENIDPNVALRCTGLLGEKITKRMEISGVAVDKTHDRIFFSLSRPLNSSDSVVVYTTGLEQTLSRDKKARVSDIELDLIPRTDPLTNQYYTLNDLCYVPNRGLLLLLSSQTGDSKQVGSNQLWFKPDNSTSARLVLEDLAPGNFGTGVAAIANEEGLYNVAITCDNNPAQNSNPSTLILLEDIEL